MLYLRHSVGRSTLRALFLASTTALAVGGALLATQALAEPATAIQTAPFASDRLSVEVIGRGPDVILSRCGACTLGAMHLASAPD